MLMPQSTNASTRDWQNSAWRLVPLNVPLLDVAPPPIQSGFQWVDVQDYAALGGVLTAQPPLTRTLDETTHEDLLQESLRDYEDIWRDLAER